MRLAPTRGSRMNASTVTIFGMLLYEDVDDTKRLLLRTDCSSEGSISDAIAALKGTRGALHLAAEWFDERIVRLVFCDSLVNCLNDDGLTALACSCKNLRHGAAIAAFLLDHGANPRLGNCDALWMSVRWCNLGLVAIFANQCDVNKCSYDSSSKEAIDSSCNSPLIVACVQRSREIISILAQAGASGSAVANRFGETALHAAARQCSADDVQQILTRHDRISPRADDGNTPLHMACRRNDSDALGLVQIFVERGSEIEARNVLNMTPLQEAARCSNLAVVKLLVSKGAHLCNCLMHAARNRPHGEDIARFLLGINISPYQLLESLESVCRYGTAGTLKLITSVLRQGYHDRFGVHFRIEWLYGRPQVELIEILREIYDQGWILESADSDLGMCSKDFLECWQMLGFGMRPESDAKSGDTALHVAARRNDVHFLAKGCHISPFQANYSRQLALDVSVSEEFRRMLAAYMQWQPVKWKLRWYTTSFRKRIRTVLLCFKHAHQRLYDEGRDVVAWIICSFMSFHEMMVCPTCR